MVAKSAENSSNDEKGSEMVPAVDWAGVKTWEDAMSVLQEIGEIHEVNEVLGDGSEMLPSEDKDNLIGVPFVVLDFREVTDKITLREYINVLIMTRDGKKYRFNDSSAKSGVMQQCLEYRDRYGQSGGLYAPRGLKVSEYIYENEKGEKSQARTFYLD